MLMFKVLKKLFVFKSYFIDNEIFKKYIKLLYVDFSSPNFIRNDRGYKIIIRIMKICY